MIFIGITFFGSAVTTIHDFEKSAVELIVAFSSTNATKT